MSPLVFFVPFFGGLAVGVLVGRWSAVVDHLKGWLSGPEWERPEFQQCSHVRKLP